MKIVKTVENKDTYTAILEIKKWFNEQTKYSEGDIAVMIMPHGKARVDFIVEGWCMMELRESKYAESVVQNALDLKYELWQYGSFDSIEKDAIALGMLLLVGELIEIEKAIKGVKKWKIM